jgi:hypothetical protein
MKCASFLVVFGVAGQKPTLAGFETVKIACCLPGTFHRDNLEGVLALMIAKR